jgi:hypothetical protein
LNFSLISVYGKQSWKEFFRAGGMAQLVKSLPSKHGTVSSNPNNTKERKKKERERERERKEGRKERIFQVTNVWIQ